MMATEVQTVEREADGVRLPNGVVVTRQDVPLPISGEPQVGETVHVACRVVGVREQDGQRVAVLTPEEVTG